MGAELAARVPELVSDVRQLQAGGEALRGQLVEVQGRVGSLEQRSQLLPSTSVSVLDVASEVRQLQLDSDSQVNRSAELGRRLGHLEEKVQGWSHIPAAEPQQPIASSNCGTVEALHGQHMGRLEDACGL